MGGWAVGVRGRVVTGTEVGVPVKGREAMERGAGGRGVGAVVA